MYDLFTCSGVPALLVVVIERGMLISLPIKHSGYFDPRGGSIDIEDSYRNFTPDKA